MKLLAKQSTLMLLVASRAARGTPCCVVRAKTRGACGVGDVTASPYKTRVPEKRAWLPADRTDVRTTVFMNDAAAAGVLLVSGEIWDWMKCRDVLDPASWRTIVNGDVVVLPFDKLG
jgi:hypothetical protein